MTKILVGGGIILVIILAVRSYFGKKYADTKKTDCTHCPRAASCAKREMRRP